VQLDTPLVAQRTEVSSTAHLCALTGGLFESAPVTESENVALQPTPLESQNCGIARTDREDPLGTVPDTSCRLMLIDVAPAAAFAATVKACSSTATV